MLAFIAFGFKLLLAAVIGGALCYSPEEKDEQKIIETSLICTYGAALLGLIRQFTWNENNLAMGFGILAVIYLALSLSDKLDFNNRIMWLFAAVIGIIIGSGYIFQAALLSILVYTILHNSEYVLNYFDTHAEESNETKIEKIPN